MRNLLLLGALLFPVSGCVMVEHATTTGYYAYKGAEGLCREIAPLAGERLIPERYGEIYFFPMEHDLQALAREGDFEHLRIVAPLRLKEYFSARWPLKTTIASAATPPRGHPRALGVKLFCVDYNKGGAHRETGFGEWHVLICRATLYDLGSGKVLGVANLEGRARVVGDPAEGLARALETWLLKAVSAETKTGVLKRGEELDGKIRSRMQKPRLSGSG